MDYNYTKINTNKPKINRDEIYYLEVSIEFPDNLNQTSFDEVLNEFVENY